MKSKGNCKKSKDARHQRHLLTKFDNRLTTHAHCPWFIELNRVHILSTVDEREQRTPMFPLLDANL